MSWKKIVADYLTFSRKDRIGILALISLILLAIYIPELFSKPSNPSIPETDSSLARAIQYLPGDISHKNSSQPDYPENGTYRLEPEGSIGFDKNAALFTFDPNTLTTDGWKKLGLQDKTIRTINNYRQKGGKFYKPEDLKKIWGLPQGFYERVEALINIPPSLQPSFSNFPQKEKINSSITIDINNADTTAFIELPGIGSKLANRIVNFRDKLGGFRSIEQVGEIYGLPDSTFLKIKGNLQLKSLTIRKISINQASTEELKAHPYIKWHLANAIVEYRNQHGNFKSIEDLKKIIIIDEITFEKIAPYISVE